MGNTPINVYFIKKQTPTQSLQADQSLYNRKGVCYIVHVIGRWLDIRTSSYICEGKDNHFSLERYYSLGK